MKKYIDQIFYEGLGKSVYLPIESEINKINNVKLRKIVTIIVKSLYFLVAISIAIMLFYFVL